MHCLFPVHRYKLDIFFYIKIQNKNVICKTIQYYWFYFMNTNKEYKAIHIVIKFFVYMFVIHNNFKTYKFVLYKLGIVIIYKPQYTI